MQNNALELTTAELLNLIRNDPDSYEHKLMDGTAVDQNDTVGGLLTAFMRERQLSIPTVILRTYLSKTYVYQILSGEKAPRRDTLLRFALALQLGLESTQKLLTVAKLGALYPKVRRDAALICCLQKKLDCPKANEFLQEIGEKELL